MKKLKKMLVIMFTALSLTSLSFSNYHISAKTTSEKKIQKGTLFKLKLDKNFSKDVGFLYADVIVRNMKWYYKNLYYDSSLKQKMITNLFNNYKIINKGDSYIINFCFFKNKKVKNYKKHLRFLRTCLKNDVNNFIKVIEKTNEENKNYSKIDNKFISEKLKNFIISYYNHFYKGLKSFRNKIINNLNEKDYENLYELFDRFLESNVKSNSCFSSVVSSSVIRNKVKEIMKILDYIIENDLENEEEYDFDKDFYFDKTLYKDYDDEYDDYDIDYEDDDEYEEYEEKKKYSNKNKIKKSYFIKLENKIKSLLETSFNMIKKFKISVLKNSEEPKYKLDDIVRSLKSVRFVNKTIEIKKHTKTSSKTSEKIVKA